jgi:xylose isomerase
MKKMATANRGKTTLGYCQPFFPSKIYERRSNESDFAVVANVAAQLRNAIHATIELGGENYVFLGRKGRLYEPAQYRYERELDHLAMMLSLARDYGRKNDLKAHILLSQSRWNQPNTQYDYDSATVIGFLRHYGLDKDFKLNVRRIMQPGGTFVRT